MRVFIGSASISCKRWSNLLSSGSPINVAVVGVGAFGRNHARVYHELEKSGSVRLVGVVDPNTVVADAVAREFDCKAFGSVEQMLTTHSEVQAASIREEGFTLVCIPMREIPERLADLRAAYGAGQPLACLCHHGMRSLQVANYLAQNGFGEVVNLQGGIDAWSQQVDPSVARY